MDSSTSIVEVPACNQGPMSTIDPYSIDPLLTEYDLYLLGEGQHYRLYERLGAQLRTVNGVSGVNFAVWAPNARRVSVAGDFNQWERDRHPMRRHPSSGYWELFIPDVEPGALYKFCLLDAQGREDLKSDPVGFQFELPPRTASIVTNLDNYTWNDHAWLERRAEYPWGERPLSTYEVHLGSWRRNDAHEYGWFNYRELADQLIPYCQEMGYTHLELLPVSEHPYTGSWGYQTVGYYGATSRYGRPEDFMYFVDQCHQHGLGVIIDWVPAHFPRDAHGLAQFDGTWLYEHADPRQGEHPEWGTLIFNYGRTEVRNFLISNALFWLDKYHIDGLRVDAVASMLYLDYSREDGQWIPNKYGGRENLEAIEFLKQFNQAVHHEYPGVLSIAEESTAWGGVSRPVEEGGLGFSMKWNMGWMNDTLRFMRHDPINRRYHHDQLTFSLVYAFSENFVLPFSHDEVVHGKGALIDQMPGDLWQKFANLRLLYTYMWTHPGKKLLFMGNDFGQWNEWNCNTELQWDLLKWETHQGIKNLVKDLNHRLLQEPALYERDFSGDGFQWIECNNRSNSTISFLRKGQRSDEWVVVACNFTPVPREQHVIGVPEAGTYREIFNSDSEYYNGSNLGNGWGVTTKAQSAHGLPYHVEATLPPLAAIVLKLDRDES